METWNREELYNEVWGQPLVKAAIKYGISAVALGKVCRKLLIPLPGRGYWIKKEFGKPVQQLPLPEAKNLPTVQRFKFQRVEESANSPNPTPEATPTDPEFLRIVEFESRNLTVDPNAKWHKLVKETERILRKAKTDEKGLLHPPSGQPCLDLRVSKQALGRALAFINAVILSLEAQGFSTSVQQEKHGTGAQIFGHRVQFGIVEKLRETGRREIKEYSWTRTIIDYEPSGQLEFRYGGDHSRKHREGKKQQLETLLKTCVAGLMREGRGSLVSAKLAEQREIERAAKQRENCRACPTNSRRRKEGP